MIQFLLLLPLFGALSVLLFGVTPPKGVDLDAFEVQQIDE